MIPKYPVYVISKGRWKSRLTTRALDRCGVPYHIVIEPQERWLYEIYFPSEKILVLPFSNLGQGSIPARNWVWDHAHNSGAQRHWILDDNIRDFYRLNNNVRIRVAGGGIFCAAETFVDRYENIGLAGFHYRFFAVARDKRPPYYLNTRIYSCILIKNDLPFRWRGTYNEDTDLSLRVLKTNSWCTVLFLAFLADKVATMTMRGGNMEKLYKGDGRLKMAESLRDQHPDVCKVVEKWGRFQHSVDYSGFNQQLRLRPDAIVSEGVDNFGMILTEK